MTFFDLYEPWHSMQTDQHLEVVTVEVLNDPSVPLPWVHRALRAVVDVSETEATTLVMSMAATGSALLPDHARGPARTAVILSSLGLHTRIGWAQ